MPVQFRVESPILRMELDPPYAHSDMRTALQEAFTPDLDEDRLAVLVVIHGNQNTPGTEIRRLASLLSEFDDDIGHRLAVSARSDLSYGLARMFAAFATPAERDIAVFRTTEEAEAWLLSDAEATVGAPPAVSGR